MFVFFSLSMNAASFFLIMFQRPETWGDITPKIHIYDSPGISDTTWPGIEMAKTCDENWFVYRAPSDQAYMNFVISNGSTGTGNQTQNLYTTATSFYQYDTSNTTEPAYKPLYNPSMPDKCVKINPASRGWLTGTNITATLEGIWASGDTVPIIYYTQDGTTPTTSSPSFTGSGTLEYNSGTNTLRAIAYIYTAVYGGTYVTSNETIRNYDFTDQGILVHLIIDDSSLTDWLSDPNIYYWSVVGDPYHQTSVSWPGVSMNQEDTNQFYFFFPYATSANMIFNNGSSGTGNQSADITNVTSEIWYHYPSGTLSTSNTKPKSEIKIYPNPVRDIVNFSSEQKVKSIDIINVNGTLIKSEILSSRSVNVSGLGKGIYLMKFNFEDGTSKVQKLVKE